MNVAHARPDRWSAVFALALAAFSLVASEWMPVSILTPIARDLGISEGAAGQAISLTGASAMVVSLSVARLTAAFDQKRVLLGFTLLMTIAGGITATAQSSIVFMAGRVMLGAAIGGFWSLSASAALRLVDASRVSTALAAINGGNALASVLAAPIGSFFGGIIGWRWAYVAVVPVAVIALAWQAFKLPSMRPVDHGTPASPFQLLGSRHVAFGMAGSGAYFMGQYAMFTYLRPYIEGTLHANQNALSGILFSMGLAGLAGALGVGHALKRSVFLLLGAGPIVMAVICILLAALSKPSIWVAAGLLTAWGFVGTALPVGWWAWLAKAMPDESAAGGGLMVAVIQLAILLGATCGGVLIDHFGIRATLMASACILLAASILVGAAARTYPEHSTAFAT